MMNLRAALQPGAQLPSALGDSLGPMRKFCSLLALSVGLIASPAMAAGAMLSRLSPI
jgi:hypothetical protein